MTVDACGDFARLQTDISERSLEEMITDFDSFHHLADHYTVACPHVKFHEGQSNYLVIFRPQGQITLRTQTNETHTSCNASLNQISFYYIKRTRKLEAYKYKYERSSLHSKGIEMAVSGKSMQQYLMVYLMRNASEQHNLACGIEINMQFKTFPYDIRVNIDSMFPVPANNRYQFSDHITYENEVHGSVLQNVSWDDAMVECQKKNGDSLFIFQDYVYLLNYLHHDSWYNPFTKHVPMFVGARRMGKVSSLCE